MKEFDKKNLKKITTNKMMDEPKKLLNGLFQIGFDVSKDKDHCCLLVAKFRGKSETMIINEFYDEEANELFRKLMGYKEGNE